jgi:Rhodanese-related sulfurtransferase
LPAKQTQPILQKGCIKGALPFNITAHFSDTTSSFPNTILQPKVFENKVQTLGIFTDSIVVCYDAQGIYSSARAWFNFKTMGFANVFVLNGGYPAWLAKNYPIEYRYKVPNKSW